MLLSCRALAWPINFIIYLIIDSTSQYSWLSKFTQIFSWICINLIIINSFTALRLPYPIGHFLTNDLRRPHVFLSKSHVLFFPFLEWHFSLRFIIKSYDEQLLFLFFFICYLIWLLSCTILVF